jgi:NAD dependent epimerase/dehydratase family enzyme
LWRPFLPFGPPDVMLEIVLGEVAQVVTKGQKVLPVKAQKLGYHFRYSEILPALRGVFARTPTPKKPSTAAPVQAGHH